MLYADYLPVNPQKSIFIKNVPNLKKQQNILKTVICFLRLQLSI